MSLNNIPIRNITIPGGGNVTVDLKNLKPVVKKPVKKLNFKQRHKLSQKPKEFVEYNNKTYAAHTVKSYNDFRTYDDFRPMNFYYDEKTGEFLYFHGDAKQEASDLRIKGVGLGGKYFLTEFTAEDYQCHLDTLELKKIMGL